MIAYEWVSVTDANRYIGIYYGNSASECNIWYNRIYSWSLGSQYSFWVDNEYVKMNVKEIVESVVADFRDAVAAGFYAAAKDDPTLVPISCLQHIDSIVFYNICLRSHLRTTSENTPVWTFKAEDFKAEWKRAVIYRRELGVFTHRMIAGDMFPENVAEISISGTPSYIKFQSKDRSL